ncbi:DNA primase [Candidatus Wolfebacteria bacterium]|nr:MAG: DNA primase [Candidatus Wolfebacteria bacterium]
MRASPPITNIYCKHRLIHMSDTTEKIKELLPIEEVIGGYIKLQKAGGNFKGLCPFHNEKTPSLHISPDRGSYYCFGCGENGDIFSFVEQFEGVDFVGALKILADKAHVPIEWQEQGSGNKNDRLRKVMHDATRFYEKVLVKVPKALEYIEKRGIANDTVTSFRIGYAPNSWRMLFDWLTKNGYTKEEVEQAGLIKAGPSGFYDRLRGRVIFPIFDVSGRPIAFSGRILPEHEQVEKAPAKYINSPETDLYNKSEVLYGFDRAKQEMREKDQCIVVEGQMDLVMSHQAGFKNTVALSGTALTLGQLTRIQRLTNTIVLAFDADGAGLRAASRSAEIALGLDMEVKVVALPDGSDPADVIIESESKWKDMIESAENIVLFYLHKTYDVTGVREKLRYAQSNVLPFIARIGNKVEQEHFVQVTSDTLGSTPDAVREEVQKIQFKLASGNNSEQTPVKESTVTPVRSRITTLEEQIAGIILSRKDDVELRQKCESIVDKERLKNLLESPKTEKYVYEVEQLYSPEVIADEAKNLLHNLEQEYLRKELEHITRSLREAEGRGEQARVDQLLAEHKTISQKIQH